MITTTDYPGSGASLQVRNSATGEKALSGLAASPVSPALGSTLSPSFEPISVLYNRHHMHCIQCIAGGRGLLYGKRCPVGLDLWNSYQSSHHFADAPEGAPLAGKATGAPAQATPPDGNHGGYFSGERTSV